MCDDIFSNGTGEESIYEVTVTVNDNTLSIECDDFDAIVADFDETTGVATFVNRYIGANSSYAFSYLPVELTEFQFTSFTATFNEDATALVFPENVGIMEGAWGWSNVLQKNAAVNAAKAFNTESSYFKGWAFGQSIISMTKGSMTYSPAGKVTYYDGLMTVNEAITETYSWDINIEKCNEIEGLYRMQPYAVENPVGTALELGVDTETYVYVNVSNPEKVFTKGQFSPYGVETFVGINPENNFNGNSYGTYKEGVITFPDMSFAYSKDQSWHYVDTKDKPNLQIVFEGAQIKEDTYSPAGKVTYYDGLMTVNDAITEIYSWDINIEKCNEVEGLYRMQPYAVENPVGTALGLGVDTETYVYVNVSNPEKVFTKGQFSPYGVETFSGVNAENKFNGEYYGTYEDGIIEFPEPSFAYMTEKGWYLVSNDGQPSLRIVFEGAQIKDYTIEAYTENNVSADNIWNINITKGADVASVKYLVYPSEIKYSVLEKNGITLEAHGTEVSGDSFTIDPVNNNVINVIMEESDYAIVYIGSFDAKGNLKEQTYIVVTVLFSDNEEGWATVGTTTFTDVYVTPFVTSTGTVSRDGIVVQAKTDNTHVYRLVNPYETFPYNFNNAGKTTSLLIDATDPEWVAIPFYLSGTNLGFGVVAVGGISALGYTKDTTPAAIPPITMSDNIITIPSGASFAHMPDFHGIGSWSQMSSECELSLPAITIDVTVTGKDGVGIEGITVSLADAENSGIETQADEVTVTTDAEGKATIEVPFSIGYFGKVNLVVNGKQSEITLNGAKNDAHITVETSQIEEITAVAADKVIYDIQGRRVANPTKGLYIINGKKALVK